MTRYATKLLPLLLAPTLFVSGCLDRSKDGSSRDEASAVDQNADGTETRASKAESEEARKQLKSEGRFGGVAPTSAPVASGAAGDFDAPAEAGTLKRPSAVAPSLGDSPGRKGKRVGSIAQAPPPPPLDGKDDAGRTDDRERLDTELPVVGSAGYHDMYFKHYGVNPTIDTEELRLSTFSADVDTTSYTMMRSFLGRGQLPPEASVRVEEFINAFDYGYEPPRDEAFSIHAEAAPSPNRAGYHLLHIGVNGKEIGKADRKAANLVFVIDVSGSMDMENRLGLVKRSLRLLVNQLDEADTVGIVTYGSTAREALAPTSAFRRAEILRVIDSLQTEGATNAEAGLRMGYRMATQRFRRGGINRVVLCSDGVANSGLTTAGGILDTVKAHTKKGITISTIGFGMGNYNDVLMEQLAQGGDGNYYYVDRLDQARKVFVENLTGTLQVIAKDVKLQVDFDPNAVARYRLLGYENRVLKAHEFNNDRVDAGEVGSGHAVTAVYEVKLKPGSGDLGKVRVRFKAPQGETSRLIERGIARRVVKSRVSEATPPTQLSFLASSYAEKLRGSYWARNVSYEDMLGRFNDLPAPLRQHNDVVELRRLIEKAQGLDNRGDKFEHNMPLAKMDFDKVPVLQ